MALKVVAEVPVIFYVFRRLMGVNTITFFLIWNVKLRAFIHLKVSGKSVNFLIKWTLWIWQFLLKTREPDNSVRKEPEPLLMYTTPFIPPTWGPEWSYPWQSPLHPHPMHQQIWHNKVCQTVLPLSEGCLIGIGENWTTEHIIRVIKRGYIFQQGNKRQQYNLDWKQRKR